MNSSDHGKPARRFRSATIYDGLIRSTTRSFLYGLGVNAGEKMYQRTGVKLHRRGVPNAPPEGFLLHDKQDEKRIASSANVPETSSVASPSILPLPQSILRPAPAPLLNPKSMLTDVGPVELWATRWRRPSAAANPQGFCWQ